MKTPLDKVLRDWNARRQPDREAREALTQRVVEAIREDRVWISPEARPWLWWRKMSYAGLGALASALLFLGLGYRMVQPPRTAEPDLASVGLSVGKIEEIQLVFKELEDLFHHRLRWVSMHDDQVQLGLHEQGESLSPGSGSDAMLVRLVMVSQTETGEAWKPVWDTDILVRGQELVAIRPETENASEVGLWIFPNEDGTMLVDTSLSISGLVPVGASSSRIMQPGVPQELLRMERDEGAFRIIQTVTRLEDG